jgi:branched-chain amino acid transport system ATP-binding protein
VDIVVNPGEIIALIGPNGAGKSTILKSIFSLADVYDGKIVFKDKDITKMPTHDLISEGISYVPQGRQVFSDMTVLENLEMGAFIFRDKELIKRNIKDVFEKFPVLYEKRKNNASTLSGGQQQMLSIARSLIQNPQLLLLDEPSLGLSPLASKDIFEKIVEINKEGVSVIIVEQNARQAVDIAHRTYVLENGKVALEGKKDIFNDKKVENIYFGGEI